jgi:hypothetical protein
MLCTLASDVHSNCHGPATTHALHGHTICLVLGSDPKVYLVMLLLLLEKSAQAVEANKSQKHARRCTNLLRGPQWVPLSWLPPSWCLLSAATVPAVAAAN